MRDLRFVYGVLCGTVLTIAGVAIAQKSIETDAVKLSPQYYTVKLENDHVRVFEYRLKPGEKEAKHTHPAGVVYTLNNARMRTTTFPDGVTSVHDWHAGDVIWRDGITHSSENIGTTDYRAVSVEVKPCPRP